MQEVLTRKQIRNIDFNCDLAQSYGVYRNTSEYDLLPYVSSVNISCGFHAGDPLSIKEALMAAKTRNIVIGAHIGFDDIQGFGNRPVNLTNEETDALVTYQVGAIMAYAKTLGMEIEYVRPHGAMYEMASKDYSFASAIANAIKKCSAWLIYYGASGEILSQLENEQNIQVAHEISLEKSYNPDGSVDFSAKDIENTNVSISRLKELLNSSQVMNNDCGKTVVKADTIHFTSRISNSLELIKQASEVITPVPVNYKKACASGWVE